MSDVMQVTAEPLGPVDDPALEALEAESELFASMGAADEQDATSVDAEAPFELELMKPRALDLRVLYKQLHRDVPADVEAALGAHRPLLLCHAMTAFASAGERPSGVWGMGYEIALANAEDASTVALAPDSRTHEIGSAETNVVFGLSAGGKLNAHGLSIAGLPVLPVGLPGVEIAAATDNSFALCAKLEIGFIEVQAGPVGAGGARWNLYRHGRDLRLSQSLLQTLLVPEDLDQLEIMVETWIRKRVLLAGLRKPWQWKSKPQPYHLSLR
ncbi:MAG: hypothetical protein WAL04_10610 [Acidimicrobiales bacterium]|jgi:hypothetical protein